LRYGKVTFLSFIKENNSALDFTEKLRHLLNNQPQKNLHQREAKETRFPAFFQQQSRLETQRKAACRKNHATTRHLSPSTNHRKACNCGRERDYIYLQNELN
jgi:hypothetical protein